MIKKKIYAKEDFKIVKLKCDINDKTLITLLEEIDEHYNFNVTDLSMLIRDILNCNDSLDLSYLISRLLNFECKNDVEKGFVDKILLCLFFEETKGIFDIKKLILNLKYKSDINEADPYYIDENTISKEIDELPFVKTL